MIQNLTTNEECIAKTQHRECVGRYVLREALVFSYPMFMGTSSAERVADTLQVAMNYLREVTGLNPNRIFSSRVIILWMKDRDKVGKATWKSVKEENGTYIGHRISLSWDYMTKPNEPYSICAHELVHPFYRISKLHKSNEHYGEGFCEFLRGAVLYAMGLEEQGLEQWGDRIEAAGNKKGKSWKIAGQLISMLAESPPNHTEMCQIVDSLIKDKKHIKEFANYLFNQFAEQSLATALSSVYKL